LFDTEIRQAENMDRRIIFGVVLMSLVALAVAHDDEHYGGHHDGGHRHGSHHGSYDGGHDGGHHRYEDHYSSGHQHHPHHDSHVHYAHHHHEHVDRGDSAQSFRIVLRNKNFCGVMSALGQSSANSSSSNGPVPEIVSDLIESTPQGASAEKVGKFTLGRLGRQLR